MPRLADFSGIWRLQRRIRHGDGTSGQAEGQVVFAPAGEGLRQHETGLLRMNGPEGPMPPLAFTRDYLWSEGADELIVRFSDGRDFHHFDATGAKASAHHICPPDDYRVAYDFSAWPDWRAVWMVSGPQKSYTMDTLFYREGAKGLHPMN
ncbi:DUF6314 family protein [Pseudooceanicola sp.]|uniref:DUF6314 family protein n=1 Tax=Pseudooceanicola sp. TaxID=1914328 RepID=UPI0026281E6F|nr:DUF6314 family protein [Pseudooceanicola sp.]MDF1854756.1 DUF6314 family protein [Pseudooceanicola sp.]